MIINNGGLNLLNLNQHFPSLITILGKLYAKLVSIFRRRQFFLFLVLELFLEITRTKRELGY